MWNKFVGFLKSVLSTVTSFLNPLARQIAKNGGALLLQTALAAVIAAEQSGAKGEDKFSAAKAVVLAKLKAEGIPIVLNAVHGAIEAAVAQIKEK